MPRNFKYVLLLTAHVFVSYISVGQNLVPNGSFEEFTLCPIGVSYTNGVDMVARCTGWKRPTQGTSDYFNACASLNSGVNVPMVSTIYFGGYQQASDGEAFVGLYAVAGAGLYREYVYREISSLEIGATYKVSMDVVLSNNSRSATNNFGVLFFENGIGVDTAHSNRIERTTQIDYTNYPIITDTANWTTLVDSFTADSAYKYIVIGSFKDTLDWQIQGLYGGAGQGYYFIDNVSIEKISEPSFSKNISLKNTMLSPNPLTNFANLSFKNHQNKKHALSIYDIQGRLMRKIEHINTSEVTIERGSLSSGCYFYELKSEDGAVSKGKLFVQ